MPVTSVAGHVLALKGITKAFQGQYALQDVDLEVTAGEIHCLLGQNGSGKSTLIKILAGYHTPHAGARGHVFGHEVDLGSPSSVHALGVRFIHQDLGLIDALTVAENLSLGEVSTSRFWLSDRREIRTAQAVLDSYGIDIDASAAVASLGVAQRTMVAIARALHYGMREQGILVLDEPTAALTAADKDLLFRLIRSVRDRGCTILYVTHRLQEVFDLADRVTVLRGGRRVDTRRVDDLDHDSLIELILGRPLGAVFPDHDQSAGVSVLEVENLAGGHLRDLSMKVRAGEIVGLVGLTGSGTEDVPHLLFGSRRSEGGAVRIDGDVVRIGSPASAIRHGIAFAPGERKRLGGMIDWNVRENLTLPRMKTLGPLKWLSRRHEVRDAKPYIEAYDVRPATTESVFGTLSGGNQQKVVIARWMRCGARVFLLEEPTAGVDVGARRGIYDAINQAAAQGSAIVLVTSDFEEAAAVCDRVLVLRDGVLGANLSRDELSVDRILGEAIRNTTEERRANV